MDFALGDEQVRRRDAIVAFARAELNAGAAERDAGGFERGAWDRCAAAGLHGLALPVELGGGGLDPLSAAHALEAFGYGCTDGGLVFAVGAHALACAAPLWQHGTDAQRRRWLPGLARGALVGALAMTEPDSGSDAFALRTRARPDGAGFRLDGEKTFVTNGPIADVALVFAVTDAARGYHGGVTAFLVERGAAGLRASAPLRTLGLRSATLGALAFDGVPLGEGAVLGGVGGGAAVFATAMAWERAGLAAAQAGAAERLLETAVAHVRARGAGQAAAHRLADVKARVEAARLLAWRAAWRLDRARDVALDASLAKLFASETLVAAAEAALAVHREAGVAAGEVERAVRDAAAATIYSGTSEIQRNLIARWMGVDA